MSQQLLSLSPDLKKLRDEGYEIEIKGQHLLIHNIPYLNSAKIICRGSLLSTLNFSGDKTITPETHVVNFVGEYPCHKDGSEIKQICHSKQDELKAGLTTNYSFSNKPQNGYKDYYEKMTTYINIISAPACSIDSSVTAKTFAPIKADDESYPFCYFDTNASRSNLLHFADIFKNQKVGIIGIGGTGSYIADLVSKTPVNEIHLFDGDVFSSHNAFRSPGASSIEDLAENRFKSDYFKSIYSKIHKRVFSHPYYIEISNLSELLILSFVFITIDNGPARKIIIDFLIEHKIPFIDCGIGVQIKNGKLRGQARVTASTVEKRNHIDKRISFAEDNTDEYHSNIQIADLNALNAVLAVIKWKKIYQYYHDFEMEFNSIYDIDGNVINNEDKG